MYRFFIAFFYSKQDNMNQTQFDVIIIGGSYAGLSAAMSLGRSLRTVLILDSGKPCNQSTPYSHNFITQDGKAPDLIRSEALEQVLRYPTVQYLSKKAVSAKKIESGFSLLTENGQSFISKKVVFATGIKDQLLEIPGFSECWGKTIIHCPYCHGFEFKDKKTGILASGAKAMHLTPMVFNLTKDLHLFTQGKSGLEDAELKKLNQKGIKIWDSPIAKFEEEAGTLKGIHFENGDFQEFDAVYAAIPFIQHSSIPQELGCQLNEQGFLKINQFQETTVSGVFACGDNSSPLRSVANAVYSGNFTGAIINKFLVDEEF